MNYADYYRAPTGPRGRTRKPIDTSRYYQPQWARQQGLSLNGYGGYQGAGMGSQGMYQGMGGYQPGMGGGLYYGVSDGQGGYRRGGALPSTSPAYQQYPQYRPQSPWTNFGQMGGMGQQFNYQQPPNYPRVAFGNQPRVYDNRGVGYTNF